MTGDAFGAASGPVTVLRDDLRRVLAPNPSPMTYQGTNSYLLGRRGIAVIDPGPDDARHRAALLAALPKGAEISHILVTHAHRDHSEGAAALAAATGAPVLAYGGALEGRSARMQALAEAGEVGGGEGLDLAFQPDQRLADGAQINGDGWALQALWTPGHIGNHLCFEELGRDPQQDRVLFSGDLVMDWATSLVSPPDGDLGAFLASLDRLARRAAPARYLPGHGAPVADPAARLAALRAHRLTRHAQIRAELAKSPGTAADLARRIYTETAPALLPAAARNVLAHLIELDAEGAATPQGPLRADAIFAAR